MRLSKKEDLVDLITAHKGLTVCKYKESNLGPVVGFRALIIAKRLFIQVRHHVQVLEFVFSTRLIGYSLVHACF